MNSRLAILVKGELHRLHKYNLTSVSVLVALIWGVFLFFLDSSLDTMLPFVLVMDATMMSIMYVGAVMFFEKSESTISTMLVTPVTNSELVLSKVLANTLHNMFASALIITVFMIIKDVSINIPLVVIAILLTTAFHTTLGVFMAYYQKDFTGMLVNVMIFSFVLFVPSVLFLLNVISGPIWEAILLINPIQAGQEIILAAFKDYEFTYKYYFSLSYLIVLGILGYKYFVLPKFQDYAVKQSGV
ncbi:hypothetical protein CI105_03365 [Candidatus Izimaplasma bacterium ZiA1]|uniref:ABC transporter permease n=1 Tax=Candidatus Izimoplasma sp. ZiA1 TaxID=2024899 RepID=UPI000BAA8461|nr:hypothetical protein CI105_03365 [Candidatus Izimaplasma bacterium ZiA1]